MMKTMMKTMMKIVILEGKTIGNDMDLSCFNELGQITVYETTQEHEVAQRVKDADIVIMNKVPMNRGNLNNATNLKMIAVTATGYNVLDKEYLDSRNITVANVAGYSTNAVAQHTIAMALFLLHKLSYYDQYVKSGEYVKSELFTHFGEQIYELEGKNWGIIGLGAIGRRTARIAEALGCHIIYYSTSGRNKDAVYEQVEFDSLLQRSDIISVHAPLNKDTENLLNLQALRKMKKTAILLNVARGPIVNEKDLAKALNEGMIGGAGLDVLTEEPMNKDNPLLNIQDSRKLLITPHIGWISKEARERLMKEVYLNIKAFQSGEKRNVV